MLITLCDLSFLAEEKEHESNIEKYLNIHHPSKYGNQNLCLMPALVPGPNGGQNSARGVPHSQPQNMELVIFTDTGKTELHNISKHYKAFDNVIRISIAKWIFSTK